MELSIIIPARNEEFLDTTVKDILKNIEADTEVIAVLDGYEHDIVDDPRVRVLKFKESIGQRAATNKAAHLAEGKYIMKVDAHCSFDKGFDRKMLEAFKEEDDEVTMVPIMRNLHAFDWVCKNGHSRYQGKSGPCRDCGEPTEKKIRWIGKHNPQSTSYRFDNTLHFQYWRDYKKHQHGDLVETMSLQGSCFMLTKERYFELNICDEKHGSWGQQGTEVACKSWLSGGRVLVNKRTWYAHMFRTQGGDFGFPYPNPGISKARSYSRDLWFNGKWDKAIRPLSWLIEKFNPPGWDVSKGVLYYTDNEADPKLMDLCQKQIKESVGTNRIVSVSLKKIDFGDNLTVPLERGPLTMFKQILTGLKELDTDIVYFTEHDVFYHNSHFDFVPEDKDTIYYNMNSWIVRDDGFAVYYDHRSLSGLCAYRETLIKHYEERIAMCEKEGFSMKMGYEPMSHGRIDWKNKYKKGDWKSKEPNIDIKHGKNLTKARWKPEDFRSQRSCRNWVNGHIKDLWANEKLKDWFNI